MRRFAAFFSASVTPPSLLAAGVALILAAFTVWFGGLNQDEGWYIYAAQLVRAGRFPYRDFFFTQGPALPFVYSVFTPVWTLPASPLHGLLGARVVTLLFGLAATGCAVALVRRLVPVPSRAAAGLAVFALLACNVYHLYFTTIPKTYALGGFFVLAGFLFLARALEARRAGVSAVLCGAAGLSLAFASGTRISLVLILPVVGFSLLAAWRRLGGRFFWFGLGGAAGLVLTYGVFALDPRALAGLLAAQRYHAARGGFDLLFSLGSVSRLARGYCALGVVALAALWRAVVAPVAPAVPADEVYRFLRRTLLLSFAAVLLLQLSAPFPYDDYQVPIMGLLTVVIVAVFFRQDGAPVPRAWFVLGVACLAAFVSPQVQEWMTYSQDRFWSRKKECSELAKLRAVGREIEALDPGGATLLTQDLYLAVETGRTVPAGLEMGPFSLFPDWTDGDARKVHVLSAAAMRDLLASAPCPVAACSGYAFAIAAPRCYEIPPERRQTYHDVLARRYTPVRTIPDFGQNATTLTLYTRTGKAAE